MRSQFAGMLRNWYKNRPYYKELIFAYACRKAHYFGIKGNMCAKIHNYRYKSVTNTLSDLYINNHNHHAAQRKFSEHVSYFPPLSI